VFDAGWGVDRAAEGHFAGTDRLLFRGIDSTDVRFDVIGNEIHIDMGPDHVLVALQYYFGPGADALIETAQFDDVTIDLRTPQAAWLTRNGSTGDDTVQGSIFGDTLDGRAGDDSIFGNLGDDSMRGGSGVDTLPGSEGDDTIRGEEGSDIISGGNGADSLHGGSESDNVIGAAGADAMDGGAGDDGLFAGLDNDVLVGNLGADSLAGEQGDDRLTGGEGADRFDFTTRGGKDRVVDFEDGIDRLFFFGFGADYDTSAEIVDTAVQDGTSVMITVPNNGTAGTTKVILLNFELENLSTADFIG
jgi:Ca2+-binding RTX toxin-like protein